MSEGAKRHLSQKMSGRKLTEETKKKISDGLKSHHKNIS